MGGDTSAGLRKRRAAWFRGRAAELAVREYLESRGVRVLDFNVRVGRYEIDVLARQDDLILVVEVRCRGTGAFESGFASITARKAQRVRSAGEALWRSRFAHDATANRMRFDVASVTFTATGEVRIEYAPAAL